MIEPLHLTFTVHCSPEHAFNLWTTRISSWWPKDHTVSQDPDVQVVFEPFEGGRIYERTANGEEFDWGSVISWSPPRELIYTWHIASDRADATEVDITFNADGESTRVEIEHRGWERLGERAAGQRDRNRAGWTSMIPHFQRACVEL